MIKYVLPMLLLLGACSLEEHREAVAAQKFHEGDWVCLVSDSSMKVRVVHTYWSGAFERVRYKIMGVATRMDTEYVDQIDLMECAE